MLATRDGTKRRKCIDIRHNSIMDTSEKFQMIIRHVPSERKKADMFTKPLRRLEFSRQRAVLCVHVLLQPLEPGACKARNRLPDRKGPERALQLTRQKLPP